MTVDSSVMLPSDVPVRDIAMVLGIAMGARVDAGMRGRSGRGYFGVDVHPTKDVPERLYKVRPGPSSVPDMLDIGPYTLMFNHRYGGKIYTLVHAGSNAMAISLFRKLAQTFGGIVELSDSSGKSETYKRPAATMDKDGLTPGDDPGWTLYQKHMAAVEPVTYAELMDADKVAAYKWKDYGKIESYPWVTALVERHKKITGMKAPEQSPYPDELIDAPPTPREKALGWGMIMASIAMVTLVSWTSRELKNRGV